MIKSRYYCDYCGEEIPEDHEWSIRNPFEPKPANVVSRECCDKCMHESGLEIKRIRERNERR